MSELTLIQKVVIYAIPIIFAITVHEVAHGWVASKLGDQTAKLMGRLTLNPIKHIDPLGTVILPIILMAIGSIIFGWAKPVPVDWRNLRRPRQDMAWVALAGPGANLIMMLFWALVAKLAISLEGELFGFAQPLFYMAMAGISINIVLAALNLLPLPPLDGSRVVSAFLPPRAAMQYNQLERYGLIILLLLLATGLLQKILFPVVAFLQNLVYILLT